MQIDYKLPKISVIIPVYNVENYLRDCLNSVTNQSHTNLEIFLIDDASTDDSGKICDIFAADDSRVSVLHFKDHQGPSAARNRALELVTGDYLSFIDSDDIIDLHMYTIMLDAMFASNADAAICDYYEVQYPDDAQKRKLTLCEECFESSDGRSISKKILRSELKDYSWNKLFLRELLEGITYPEGVLYEDVSVVFRFFIRAQHVIHVNRPLYYYLRHKNSITCSFSVQKEIDYNLACLERLKYCEELEHDLIGPLSEKLFSSMLTLNNTLIENNSVEELFNDPVLLEISEKLKQDQCVIYENYHGLFPGLKLRLLSSKRPLSHKLLYQLYKLNSIRGAKTKQ